MKKGMLTVLATIAALAIGLGTANATSVNDTLFTGVQLFSDNSAETLDKSEDNCVSECTILEVDDILRGIFEIATVEKVGPARDFGTVSVNEFSGIFEIMVVAKIEQFDSGGDSVGWLFIFGPSPDFESIYGTDAVAALFDDDGNGTEVYDRTTLDVDDGIATASDGVLFWVFGLVDDRDFWVALTLTDDLSNVDGFEIGDYNFGLTRLTGLDTGIGVNLGLVSCTNNFADPDPVTHDVNACGGGGITVPSIGTGFDVFNNIDFTVNVIPEPGSLALLGFGLLGLGALTRRKRA